ncbi:MAG TPA: alpha/beta fold hydrolase, partial [Gammaproteobacteria bacterium]
ARGACMIEEIRRFGKEANLSGILARPAPGTQPKTPVTFIFITAGLLHKPGPYRLYVELSRALAAAGFHALRFDLAGIGESAPVVQPRGTMLPAIADVRDVMDALSDELGSRRFVLAGLCSGAEVAHLAALADERVAGIIALDGYLAKTRKFYLWHYLPRILSARKWMSFIAGIIGERIRHFAARRIPKPMEPDPPELAPLKFWERLEPGRDELAAQFRTLAGRGVLQLQVFSGGSGICSYQRQFNDAFSDVDFRGTSTVHFLRPADHMYILRADRRRLTGLVTQWAKENFTARQPSAEYGANRDPAPSSFPANLVMPAPRPAGIRRSCE